MRAIYSFWLILMFYAFLPPQYIASSMIHLSFFLFLHLIQHERVNHPFKSISSEETP